MELQLGVLKTRVGQVFLQWKRSSRYPPPFFCPRVNFVTKGNPVKDYEEVQKLNSTFHRR